MVIVPKFTPEILISAPRRAPAVPNRDGTLALFSQSTHTIGEEKTLKEVRVMKVESGESQQLTADEKVHDFVWLPADGGASTPTSVVWLKKGDEGVTLIEMADAANPSKPAVKLDDIAAPVDNLKLKALKDGSIAFVVVGLADDEGELYNPEKHKKLSSIRIHDEYDVRLVSSPIYYFYLINCLQCLATRADKSNPYLLVTNGCQSGIHTPNPRTTQSSTQRWSRVMKAHGSSARPSRTPSRGTAT